MVVTSDFFRGAETFADYWRETIYRPDALPVTQPTVSKH